MMNNPISGRCLVFAALYTALTLSAGHVHAGLTLSINTVAETYTFSGSAVVDPNEEFVLGVPGITTDQTNYAAMFDSSDGGFGVATFFDLSGVTATPDVGSVTNQPPFGSSPYRLAFFSGFSGAITDLDILLQFGNSAVAAVDPGNITFSGDGATYSYSSLTSAQKTFLAGTTFPSPVPLTQGTAVGATDTFTINATAVPEPSSFLFLGMVGLLGTAIRWAKRTGLCSI